MGVGVQEAKKHRLHREARGRQLRAGSEALTSGGEDVPEAHMSEHVGGNSQGLLMKKTKKEKKLVSNFSCHE